MKGLLFIRHAETDMAGTFCGHSDAPINAVGRAQVDDLIAQIAGDSFDAIYSSDLRRAMDTAAPLAQAWGVRYIATAALREIYFGAWEGRTWAEIELQDAEYARRWVESYPMLAAPGGEPFAAFERRVLKAVDRLLRVAEDEDKRIAVVTHAGVMRVVLVALGHSEQEAWERTKPYCSFFVYAGALQESNR